MGNVISLNDKTPVEERINMSNGLTSAFIDVLILSGSHIAKTDDEKRLIIWLTEKDQSRMLVKMIQFYVDFQNAISIMFFYRVLDVIYVTTNLPFIVLIIFYQ